jgi:hypothetical protein
MCSTAEELVVQSPVGQRSFFFFPKFIHQPWGSLCLLFSWFRAVSVGIKWPGHEADHLHPSYAKINSTCSFTYIPPYLFMASCLMKHRNCFTSIFASCSYLDRQKIFSHYVFMTKILQSIMF